MARSSKQRWLNVLLLVFGWLLTVAGLAISGMIIFAGTWALMHMYPVLLISTPMLVIGVLMLRRHRKAVQSGDSAIN